MPIAFKIAIIVGVVLLLAYIARSFFNQHKARLTLKQLREERARVRRESKAWAELDSYIDVRENTKSYVVNDTQSYYDFRSDKE